MTNETETEEDWKTRYESWLESNESRLKEEYILDLAIERIPALAELENKSDEFNEWCKQKWAEEGEDYEENEL